MADNSGPGLGMLIAAKIVCCSGLVLAATGALSGLGAWLAGGGYIWIGGIAGTLFAGLALHSRRRGLIDTGSTANAVPGHRGDRISHL